MMKFSTCKCYSLVVVLLSLHTLARCRNYSDSKVECPPWFYYNSATNRCMCYHDTLLDDDVHCTETGILVDVGNCMTYENNVGTFFARCFYFQLPHGNFTVDGSFSLPNNASELNDYMCGPMNRKGLVCSECIDGFGPSVTSFGYKCANCSDSWSGVLLYVLVEFGPTTLFYLVVLTFRISLTSAPMTCFILYSQLIVYSLFEDPVILNKVILQSKSKFKVELIKVIGSLYGAWNLESLKYIVPPVCISSKLSIIHVLLLRCLSALYSLLLVVLTWICVELHGHNFRPLVLLWRPFHRCFVRLRKGWDTRKDIIDVFATFLLLTYSKLSYQSLEMLASQYIIKDGLPYARVILSDPSITYMSSKHLPFVVVSLIILIVFVIPPPFILLLYPTRAFNACLTKCKLNGQPGVALKIFVDKYYACYKDKSDCGYDMRTFSALYFFLRPLLIIIYEFRALYVSDHMWVYAIILFASVSILIALVKPYKHTYMNILDTLLLAHLSLLCLLVSTPFKNSFPVALSETLLLLVPMIVFITYIIAHLICKLKNITMFKKSLSSIICCLTKAKICEQDNSIVDHTRDEHQHLIPPPRLINNNELGFYGST